MFTRLLSLILIAVSGPAASARAADVPLGDGHTSTTTAKRGSVYACGQPNPNGGGAFKAGSWIHGSTWSPSEKPSVQGSVTWSNATFTSSKTSSATIFHGNGLPVGLPTGRFPIASSDPAFQYDRNPNSITEQTTTYTIPSHPTEALTPSCLSGGPIGVATDGVAIFDALDAGWRDAAAHEILDTCGGHPQQQGLYHYHAISRCLDTGSSHSASHLIGRALDGYPIFGNRGPHGKRYTNADLDACHGMTSTVTIDGRRVRTYHYVATPTYPYTLGCYKGTPSVSGQRPQG